MADRWDLVLYQGDDFSGTVTVNTETGPLDLTGYTAQAQIRTAVADTQANISADIGATVTPSNIVLAIAHDVTQAMKGNYVWDLKIVDGSGFITTIVAGNVAVIQQVTR